MNILGIDIGGTSIKSDVYNEDGNALGHFQNRVPRYAMRTKQMVYWIKFVTSLLAINLLLI